MSQQQLFAATVQPFDMHGADITYTPEFIPGAEATQLMQRLISEVSWEQPRIKMFGREVLSPRLHGWYGDADAIYQWSGRRWQPLPWTPVLKDLRDRVEAFTKKSFNSCLVNRYRNGQDSMGLHADDEPELGSRPVIASLSLGAERDFEFRARNALPDGQTDRCAVALESGSLLVMAGDTQANWKHHLPKRSRVSAERLNLTFRNIEIR